MTMRFPRLASRLAVAAALSGVCIGLSGCDPYNPGQRAVGGAALGAGAGALIGGVSGGHAGMGALIGGGLGAIGGAATTPSRGY